MYAVSDEFLTAVQENTRTYYWSGTITTTAGKVYDFDYKNIVTRKRIRDINFSRNPNVVKGKAYPRWLCRAKKEGGLTCRSVSYPEKKLMDVSAEILGLEIFDESAFEEQVREMTVMENGDIVFNLFGGDMKTWVRPPKPVKLPQPVREKKPPEHCFDGKIFCGNCGRRFGRVKSDTKDHHIYWHCSGKDKVRTECKARNIADNEIRQEQIRLIIM